MKAIVLAAGKGTRLGHLSKNTPKCLMKVNGRPLIQWQLDAFEALGISDVTIVGGYANEALNYLSPPIIVNEKFSSTNMVFSLFCASHLMDGSSDLIVSYGDIVFEPRVLRALLNSIGDISVVVDKKWKRYWLARMENPLEDAETLKLDGRGFICELGEKASGYGDIEAQYIGLIKFNANVASRLPLIWRDLLTQASTEVNPRQMYMTEFIQHLIGIGFNVNPAYTNNGWLEVDTPSDLKLEPMPFFDVTAFS